MCFPHGMRMCMWIGHSCWINFCHFFGIVNLVIFHPEYIDSGYLLWAQLLLQFCTNCFETLHVFSSWYEDVHVDCTLLLDQFLSLFRHCKLSHFSPWIYRQWVFVVSATPLTLLKLCVCFLHDMRMCMWFAYNCCINFCQFSPFIYRLCDHMPHNTIPILCPLLKLMLHLCPPPPPPPPNPSKKKSFFFSYFRYKK